MKMECNYLIGWIRKKAVTYTKISPKMVNPRDIAGERRRRRRMVIPTDIAGECRRRRKSISQADIPRQLYVLPHWNHLIGLVVKASASGAEDPGSDCCLHRGHISGMSHIGDWKIGSPVATLPGTWCYRISAGTGWPGVSILWLGEVESFDLQVLSPCGSMQTCLSRSVSEIDKHVAGTLSKQPIKYQTGIQATDQTCCLT